jgi:hypothetical protein
MEKVEQGFLIKYLWMNNWGSKEIVEQPMTTLGVDAYGGFKSKSNSRSLETAINLVKMFQAPGGRP